MTVAQALPYIAAYLTVAAVVTGLVYGHVSATGKRKWKAADDDGFMSGVIGVFWPVGIFFVLSWVVAGMTKWTVTEVTEPRKNKVRL